MHGGAFVFGDLDMNEAHMVSAELAHRAGAIVVSVDYRLAVRGVKFPIPVDDVVAAWEWLVGNAAELGVDADRISIGGASAGGNLAAAASLRLRSTASPPRSMLLAYPPVHFPMPALEPETLDEMRVMPPALHFSVAYHEWKTLNYLGRITNVPAGVAPGNFELNGLPPAFIAPAEFDELRPSAELFARQLDSVGVPVTVQLAEGMVHGFLNRTPSLPAVDRTLGFLSGALGSARAN
jgi:acetyl esterase/lipase